MKPGSIAAVAAAALLACAGCATMSAPERAELSSQVQHLTELRDTCTQYAAWMMKDLDAKSPEYKEGMQLYIEASAAANSYIESLRFDTLVASPMLAERYEKMSARVSGSCEKFVQHARQSLGFGKERGLPLLIIPAAMGLVDLASKLNGLSNAASEHQRSQIATVLGEAKWKTIQDIKPAGAAF